LTDDIDISRGDTIVKVGEKRPSVEQDITLAVCWFNETQLRPRNKYILRQTTSETPVIVRSINFRRNINTLEKEEGVEALNMNDIAEITIHTANPLVFDDYRENRITGSLIFIDPDTNETMGAGMIRNK
jgi:sulfate adenylyltransferase subunit 1